MHVGECDVVARLPERGAHGVAGVEIEVHGADVADDVGACGEGIQLAVDRLVVADDLRRIAAAQFNWRSKLHIDARFSAEGMRWTWGPGDLWGFDGRLDHYADYTSVAQVVERDLATDTVRVTVGAKAQLALSEQIQLSRVNRTRGDSSGDCRNPPTPPAPEPSGNPLEPVAIEDSAEVVVMAGYVDGIYTADVELGVLTGSGEIWLEVTTDSEGVATSIAVDEGASIPSDDDTHAYYALGHYEVASGLVTVTGPHLGGNLTHSRCRDYFTADPTYTHRFQSDT